MSFILFWDEFCKSWCHFNKQFFCYGDVISAIPSDTSFGGQRDGGNGGDGVKESTPLSISVVETGFNMLSPVCCVVLSNSGQVLFLFCLQAAAGAGQLLFCCPALKWIARFKANLAIHRPRIGSFNCNANKLWPFFFSHRSIASFFIQLDSSMVAVKIIISDN